MISDTGAMTGQQPSVQPTYLNLLGSVLPTAFPLIKAVVYQDGPAPGPQGAPYDYTLDQAGQSAFDSLSASPYFQPDRFGHDHVGLGLGHLAPAGQGRHHHRRRGRFGSGRERVVRRQRLPHLRVRRRAGPQRQQL